MYSIFPTTSHIHALDGGVVGCAKWETT